MPHNSTTPTPPADLCPICGGPNLCAMEIGRVTGVMQEPCWCTKVKFSQKVLERIPAEAANTACVCAACRAAIAA